MNDFEKFIISWGGAILGLLTLNNIVLLATLIFTCLQIAIAIRKLRKPAERD